MESPIVPNVQDVESMIAINPLAKEQVMGFAKDRRIAELEARIKDLMRTSQS